MGQEQELGGSAQELVERHGIGAGARLLRLTEVAGRLRGARMCYGEPVQAGDRTVIPVASLFLAGGLGFGESTGEGEVSGNAKDGQGREGARGGGGGGGGTLTATPIGYIEIGEDGARFRRIVDPLNVLRALGTVAVPVIAAAVARRARRRR